MIEIVTAIIIIIKHYGRGDHTLSEIVGSA